MASNAFGCVVSGRLVQTNFTQVDQLKMFLEIKDATNVKHICLFMTGVVALPADAAATLHFAWGPDFNDWQYIGFLCNNKPSSIFQITPPSDTTKENDLRVGISIEPLQSAMVVYNANQEAKLQKTSKNQTQIAENILQNLFNYVSSFNSPSGLIPYSYLEKWYNNFLEKLKRDPNFFIVKRS